MNFPSFPSQVLRIVLFALIFVCSLACNQKEATSTDKTNEPPSLQIKEVADDLLDHLKETNEGVREQLGLPADRLQGITLEAVEKEAQFAQKLWDKLQEVEEESLSHDDVIMKALLEHELWTRIEAPKHYWLGFSVTPYSGGWQVIGQPSQILSKLPLNSQENRKNYLLFVQAFNERMNDVFQKTKIQQEKGILLPKDAVPGAQSMLEGNRESIPKLITNVDERLIDISEEDKNEFKNQLEDLSKTMANHFQQIINLLGTDYLNNAPQSVGLGQYPGGTEYYKYLIKSYTGLELNPKDIHEMGAKGLQEAAEKQKKIRDQLSFEGSAEEFKEQLRNNPRFYAKSPEEVEALFMEHIKNIEPLLPDYFSVLPKAPYGVRRLKPQEEPGMTYGYYNPPTPNDNKGYYNYNGSKLDQRNLLWAQHLIYHELVPGHHFHLATQQEKTAYHPIRRFMLYGAFTEGWAEYAASLGEEMGLYSDPYDLYGHLFTYAFFANRLYIDTGMNFFGWSLEKGREEMLKNTFESKEQVGTETLRYSTDLPAQALNYMLGYLKIWELRKKAEAKLGKKFDLKEFHAQTVGQGAMPLNVLEKHIDWYINEQL